jgi:hypothetical protein
VHNKNLFPLRKKNTNIPETVIVDDGASLVARRRTAVAVEEVAMIVARSKTLALFSSSSPSSFILKKTDRIIVCSFVRPSLRAHGNILALSTFSEPLNKQKKKRKIIMFSH